MSDEPREHLRSAVGTTCAVRDCATLSIRPVWGPELCQQHWEQFQRSEDRR